MKNPTQTLLVYLAVTLASLGFGHVAQAQSLDAFSGAAITGDSDVNNVGTLVLAYDLNGATLGTQTVNGVSFVGGSTENITQNGVSYTTNFTHVNGATTFDPAADPNPPGASTAYLGVIGGGEFAFNAPATENTLTLGGLTIGDTYEFQIFAFDARSGSSATSTGKTATLTGIDDPLGDSETLTLDGSESKGDEGSYAIATFTAVSTTQEFTLSGTDPQANAIDLFNEGVAPEPSTFALMGLALTGLVVVRRFRGIKLT